ncbi:Uncharacterised protein [uncultured archaeon]|nr:Uncharacterised protein [uncultured archaeon]
MDFTLIKYNKLCKTIATSDYNYLTVHDFLLKSNYNRALILRHDVDRKPIRALKMAQIENQHGMRSTYYFRIVKEVFRPEIIKQIVALGHEIGYHYEVLDKAKGDIKKAVILFENELKEFRKIVEISTICMHGNPLTSWVNKDIWKEYSFKDFGIIGEAYLSIDYSSVSYFTDTGRAWNNSKHSIKDIVKTNSYKGKIKSTDDLMSLIMKGTQENMCISTHPNRWTDNFPDWLQELAWQNIKNMGKAIINK